MAFNSNRGDLDYAVWTVAGDGTGLRRLAGNPKGEGDFSPSWSPDGTRIAFMSRTEDGSDIYTMSVDGAPLARLTSTGAEGEPAWSPDGTKIAYVRYHDSFVKLCSISWSRRSSTGTKKPGRTRQGRQSSRRERERLLQPHLRSDRLTAA